MLATSVTTMSVCFYLFLRRDAGPGRTGTPRAEGSYCSPTNRDRVFRIGAACLLKNAHIAPSVIADYFSIKFGNNIHRNSPSPTRRGHWISWIREYLGP